MVTLTPATCENCISGFTFEGKPAGKETKIGPYNVYVAQPAELKRRDVALVYFTDMFGLQLINNKLLSDQIANETGLTVYVPDMFHGDGFPVDAVRHPETADEIRSQSTFGKITSKLAKVKMIPWFTKHKPAITIPEVETFIGVLKNAEYGHTNIGAVGYCYGAAIVTHLNAKGYTTCSVICHPSLIGKSDIERLKTPITFALADADHNFDPDMRTWSEKTLQEKKVEASFVVYPGTTHGFAARGNLKIERVREGAEGAFAQTTQFFSSHLL